MSRSSYNFEILAGNENHNQCALTELSRLPTMKMIRQQQLDDPVLGKVLYELEAIQTPLRFSGVKWNQPILKRFKQIQSQLQLVNGVLTRNYKVEPFSDLRSVIIVPDTLKQDLLCQAHDDAGHQGVERTLSRAKYLGFWVGMGPLISMSM